VPLATSGKLRLHYRSSGRGPAVLLVMGLGMTADAWWRTVPVLARSFRALTFDNRGVAASDAPLLPYSVASMADDAIAVLDAAGEERAHVYGISLGGMVAQEIALRHPERVRALVLGATTPGALRGPLSVDGVAFFARAGAMTHEEALWASVPYTYAEDTRRRHADRIGEDIARRLEQRPGILTHSHQLVAAAGHATLARLPGVSAPTLVVHGEQDAIVPADNARLIADAIPRAELELSPSAGHLYMTDDPRIDHRIHRFLLCHTPERRTTAERLQRARGRLEARRRHHRGRPNAAQRLAARAKRAAGLR